MKYFLTFFIMGIGFIFFSHDSFALTVKSQTGNIYSSPFQFNSAKDWVEINFKPNTVYQIYVSMVDSNFENPTHERTYNVFEEDPPGLYYSQMRYTCNVNYLNKYYDSYGNLLGTSQIQVTELVNPFCDSTPNDPDQIGNDSGNSDCGTIVCDCLAELKGVNNQILDSSNLNGQKLDTIVNGLHDNGIILGGIQSAVNANGVILGDIRDSVSVLPHMDKTLGDILGELTTSDSVDDGVIDTPSVPPTVDRIERNKPVEKPIFSDDSTHFTDQGNAPAVDRMPDIPDPSECWTNVGSVCVDSNLVAETPLSQEPDLVRDPSLLKDDSLSKDDELIKNPFSQDTEMSKNPFLQDNPFSLDTELDKDVSVSDPVLNKDTSLSKDTEKEKSDSYISDPSLSPTSEMQQDNFYNVSE
jgi:hypothetical protein